MILNLDITEILKVSDSTHRAYNDNKHFLIVLILKFIANYKSMFLIVFLCNRQNVKK